MKKLLFVLVIPLLIGCSKKESVNKIIFVEYNESGTMTEVEPIKMKEVAIDNKIDSLFYVGLETCSSCVELHGKLNKWCSENKGTIYYIPSSSINDENLHYITESAVGAFGWQDKQTLPVVFFFSQGELLISTGADNTMKNINKYVGVLPQN